MAVNNAKAALINVMASNRPFSPNWGGRPAEESAIVGGDVVVVKSDRGMAIPLRFVCPNYNAPSNPVQEFAAMPRTIATL
jgi:hypothetical protein